MPDSFAAVAGRAVIASSDVVVRQGIRAILMEWLPAAAVTEANSVWAAAKAAVDIRPAVLLLDVGDRLADVLSVLPGLACRTVVVAVVRRGDERHTPILARRGAAKVFRFDDLVEEDLVGAVRAAGFPPSAARATVVRLPVQQARRHPVAEAAGQSGERVVRLFAGPQGSEAADLAQLSPREIEVLRQMALGLRNRDVAQVLWMSEKTVKNHINRIFAKLHVDTRAQAILRWLASCPRIEEHQPTG
ncbi:MULTISPECIES: helix-turn-helix transcriptional regulator [Amycolatopsis]|uniref:LuxR C-terminal-related transcriptional regulator n=1 Tax=Amycolatopsis albidoflavus TaxID=102226 RepID=A0ABW5I7T2_9PSEU